MGYIKKTDDPNYQEKRGRKKGWKKSNVDKTSLLYLRTTEQNHELLKLVKASGTTMSDYINYLIDKAKVKVNGKIYLRAKGYIVPNLEEGQGLEIKTL
jgi:hypothetical protein